MLKNSLALLTLVALTACGPAPQPPAAADAPTPAAATAEPAPAPAAPKPRPAPVRRSEPAPAPVVQACSDCGVITAVDEKRIKGDASAVGTLGGAAAGGVAGAQFGKKSGKILATIGGAVLGGLAGREVEKQVKATHVYDVTVNMDAGGSRTVRVAALNGLGVGSKVRVSGDSLIPN